MNALVVAPLLTPLVVAVAAFWVSHRHRWLHGVVIGGMAIHLLVAVVLLARVVGQGTLATQLGGWPAPFGISFVADPLCAIFVLAVAVVAACGASFSLGSIGARPVSRGYYPLYLVLTAGASGALLVGDVFSLYVMIELMLTASFVLLGIGGERLQLEGAFKYVVLNLIASALLLSAVGLLYHASGTLNMAELAWRAFGAPATGIARPISLLFLVALGIKCAVFPLYFWLPASYHTPPTAISAVFAGLLTKVGVYLLLRMFIVVFPLDDGFTRNLLLAIAAATMISGVLGAVVQQDVRRILAVHIISQVGYMVMGLGLFTRLGIAAAIYFTIHNMIVKTNLFFVGGLLGRLGGTQSVARLGGIYAEHGWIAALFLVPALSLAGMPPLSGFVGKLALLEAAFDARAYALAAVSLAVSLWTLFSMIKIWTEAIWKPAPSEPTQADGQLADVGAMPRRRVSALLVAPCVVLTLFSVSLGVLAAPVMELCLRAADELLEPRSYVHSVLREGFEMLDTGG